MNKVYYPVLLLLLCLFSCKKHTLFQQVSSSHSGIHFNNQIIETDSINPMDLTNIYNGGGVGVGDINNDGTASNDLLYVPKNTEIDLMQFASLTDVNGVIQNAAAQKAAFKSFIAQDKYLSSRRGTGIGRFADRPPARLSKTSSLPISGFFEKAMACSENVKSSVLSSCLSELFTTRSATDASPSTLSNSSVLIFICFLLSPYQAP